MFDSEFLVLNITFNSRFYDRFSHTKVFDLSTTASFQIFFPVTFLLLHHLRCFFLNNYLHCHLKDYVMIH